MVIQLVESDIQQLKFVKKKATKGEKHSYTLRHRIRKGIVEKGIVHKGIVHKGIVGKGIARKGIVQKGIARKGIVHKGIVQKGIVRKGIVHKGIVRKGIVQKGIVRKGIVRKGIVRKGIVQKGIVHKGIVRKCIVQKGIVNEKIELESRAHSGSCDNLFEMVRYGFRARSSLFVPTGHLYSVLKACLKRDFTASEQWNRERLYFFPLRANNRGPFKIDKCFPRWRTTSVSSS